MTEAFCPIPNRLNIEPRIWFMLHSTTAGKKTSDKGAVVVLNVVTTETREKKMEPLLKDKLFAHVCMHGLSRSLRASPPTNLSI